MAGNISLSKVARVFNRYEYFFEYNYLEDMQVMSLVVMDQCRVVAEEAVKALRGNKRLFKREVKLICNNLYNPSGVTYEPNNGLPFKGWTRRLEHLMMKNMSEDEQVTFSIINGEFDDLIKLDLIKMRNAVSIEVGKHDVKDAHVFSQVAFALVFADMCHFILENAIAKNRGNIISLCKEANNPEKYKEAFRITGHEVARIYDLLGDIMRALYPNLLIEIPRESAICTSVTTISTKILSPHNIYRCAENAGMDLRKTSNPLNFPEAFDKRREAMRVDVNKKEKTDAINKVDKLAEAKGWKIKKVS